MENESVSPEFDPKEVLGFLISQIRIAYLDNDVVRACFLPVGQADAVKAAIDGISEEIVGQDHEAIKAALGQVELHETEEALVDDKGQPADAQVLRLSELPEFRFRQKMSMDQWLAQSGIVQQIATEGPGIVPNTDELRLVSLIYTVVKMALRESTGEDVATEPTPPKLRVSKPIK